MTWLRDNCPQCDRQLVNSRFDTAFRMPDGSETLHELSPGMPVIREARPRS